VSGGWWPEQRRGDLVTYLGDQEYRRLLEATEPAQVEPGAILLHKGSPSRSLLLIEEGEIEIFEESLGAVIVLDRIGSGSVVGEVGFLDGLPRTHGVRAGTACKLRRLTRERLLDLVRGEPELFAKLMIALAELLARRFRSAVAELEPVRVFAATLKEPEEALDSGPGTAGYDELDDPLGDQALGMIRAVARRSEQGAAKL
jgi:CRP/FNR family transcriptional regulator, cyclic AMP receptor protein